MSRTLLNEVSIVNPPAIEPVSLDEAKNYSKIEFIIDDDLLRGLITSARIEAERYTNRTFITTTLKAFYTQIGRRVRLPSAPIQSVTSVTSIRQNTSVVLTVDEDFFIQGIDDKFLDIESSLSLTPGHSLRDTLSTSYLEVEYIAGYGLKRSEVPENIRTAIMKIVENNYDLRGDSVIGTIVGQIPNTAKVLLNPFKAWVV